MEYSLIIPAFIAGILTFLAPCTFPLVPAYLGFISGVSGEETNLRRKVFMNGMFYVLGFSLIFVIFGTFLGFLGHILVPARIWLSRIAGIFIILFGLMMLNVVRVPFLLKERQLILPFGLARGKPLTSFLLGGAFAFGWTPCVGPVLGSILLLASTSTTALQGGLLLAIFSAGLAVPFLILAWTWGSAQQYVEKLSKYLWIFSLVGGLILIGLGILLLTNRFSLLIQWGYWLFRFINYEKLIDYL
jgi:cytochrome c-type biogenesis protein